MSDLTKIKQLRQMTGCGMMDCKKALAASGDSLDEAALWLRKNGMAKAAKKADRDALEGAVGVTTDGGWGALVQLASETDFVARNKTFQELAGKILDIATQHKPDTLDALLELQVQAGQTVDALVKETVGVIGESIRLANFKSLKTDGGHVGFYVHNGYTDNLGKIGVLVALQPGSGFSGSLEELAEHLAMHVVASNPLALRKADLDPSLLEKEEAAITAEATESGKPAAALPKIIEGRMQKFLKGILMEEQPFIMDEDKTVAAFLKDKDVTLVDFAILKVGAE